MDREPNHKRRVPLALVVVLSLAALCSVIAVANRVGAWYLGIH